MSEIRRYRNSNIPSQKVFVITDENVLTIDVKLMRSPIWSDEHSMQFTSVDKYREVEYDIFTVLRDKGFVWYEE